MQTLKLSLSILRPDATYADMELRLCANDADCNVVSLPPAHAHRTAKARRARYGTESPSGQDDYVLGGYAGI